MSKSAPCTSSTVNARRDGRFLGFSTGPSGGPVFPTDNNLGFTGDQVVFKVNIMVAHFNPFH
jgi:hypothetical protein